MSDDPRVAKLLRLLWNADSEAGVAIVKLHDSLRDEALLTDCHDRQLIEFGRRNHCHVGGELKLENGYSFTLLSPHKPDTEKKRTRQLLREALAEDVEPDIRHRIRLTGKGEGEASRLMLTADAQETAGTPVAAAVAGNPNEAVSYQASEFERASLAAENWPIRLAALVEFARAARVEPIADAFSANGVEVFSRLRDEVDQYGHIIQQHEPELSAVAGTEDVCLLGRRSTNWHSLSLSVTRSFVDDVWLAVDLARKDSSPTARPYSEAVLREHADVACQRILAEWVFDFQDLATRVRKERFAFLKKAAARHPASPAAYERDSSTSPSNRRRRRRKQKTLAQNANRELQLRIDDEIVDEWTKRRSEWESYGDYAQWKNQYLPAGWPVLDAVYVEQAIARVKARLKRKQKRGQRGPGGSRGV